MKSTFRALRVYNYRLWFVGFTVSNLGVWMARTAQDWIVLTELTDYDAAAVGLSMALQFAPILLLAPLAGLAADTIDRRRLLVVTQTVMGTLCLALGVLYLTGLVTLWMVYAFSLLLGIASAFDGTARQSFVTELVSRELTTNAIGLNGTSFTLARLIGPALAGLLTAVLGAGWVFTISCITFAATIVAIGAMRREELNLAPPAPPARARTRAGLVHLLADPDLKIVFLSVFVFGTLGMNFPIFIATMAGVEFGLGVSEFGLLSSVVAIGSVTGAL
ncbi:MAG TPA: MFS transporter, partial [Naasia sp.]